MVIRRKRPKEKNIDQGIMFKPASLKQEMFLNSDVFLTVYGGAAGSGKSYMGLMRFLRYVDDPLFSGYVFRKNATDMKGGGGLFQNAVRMFMAYDEKVTYTKQPMCITFPSGATINFTGLDGDQGMDAIQGIEISAAMLDEATHFTEEEVIWIQSRLRGKVSMEPCMWLTCNPDPDSFLCKWLEPNYLYPRGAVVGGELVEGRPDPSRDGSVLYFLRGEGDKLIWSPDYDKMVEQYSKNYPIDPTTGETSCKPKSFRFISATCLDNPPLLEANPNYVSTLANMSRVKRERLLYGNWFAREEEAGYWKREWCEVVLMAPDKVFKRVRCWDIAGTLPTESNPDPDWTASVLMSRARDGYYYVEDVVRERRRIMEVLELIAQVSLEDQQYCSSIVFNYIPKDPNASGQWTAQQWIRELASKGVAANTISTVGAKSKLQRFLPFCAVSEQGLVKIVKGAWNEVFFSELESFNGERRSRFHDDQVDACSDAFMKVSINRELANISSSAIRM